MIGEFEPLAPAALRAYLARIGCDGRLRADAATLATLHAAHVAAIPFENLDVRWGKGIPLDAASLVAKLVHGGRGGYCFEQNGLFAAALRALGFRVQALGARVRYRATRELPRTHQLSLVEADGVRWIADVGFGGQTLLAPIALQADRAVVQGAWRYTLAEAGGTWALRMSAGDDWVDLYAFTLEPLRPADLEMANWYVSTHPASRFVQTLTVQRATPQARHILQNREYSIDRGLGPQPAATLAPAEIVPLLERTFGLTLAPNTALPLPPA